MNALVGGLLFVGFGLYFLPVIVAVRRKRCNVLPLALFNLLFGWSILGWFAAMLWARHFSLRGIVARSISD
jgi:hypothetical protein